MKYLRIIVFTLSLSLLFLVSCDKETKRLKGFAVHGLDVSHYQQHIHWDSIAQQDIKFVFVKASEGESIRDSLFQRNWKALKKYKIKRGAYHFFRPGTDVQSQFDNFKSTLSLANGDLPPVLDVEVTDGKTQEEIIAYVKHWLQLAEKEYQIKPIIYSNFKFYNSIIAGQFDDYPIWIARYSYTEPVLNYGDSWAFWQYGNKGRIKGIKGDVDFNVFNGSLSDLDKISFDKAPFSLITQ